MTKEQIIEVLLKAKPCETADGFVLDEHKKAVSKAISLIRITRNPYHMMVLSKRYLEGKSIKEIAYDMQCGKTTVHRLINTAIEEILDGKVHQKRSNGKEKGKE